MGNRLLTLSSKLVPTAIFAVLSSLGVASAAETPDPAALKFFETKIRPLLSDQCFKCHSEKKQKANLRLDNLHYILQGGDGGPAVVPGDSKESLVMKAVSYEDSDLQMPPDNKLEPAQIADLKKWIELGAPWPADEVKQAANHKPGEFSAQDRAWWAFQPVKAVAPPKLPNSKYTLRNEVDKFIAARLQQENFPQAPEADRTEFVRRAYFDLHGIAPTPEQVKAFVEDKSTDAYDRLIEDLLKSPRYGERWAQHWLDLVRYGESDGYRQDAYRPEAWRYRDYVVRSFNDDKPYDRFVKEQLAGDEIDPNNPDCLIGTSYLRQTVYEYNERDAEGQRTTILNEITDVTGELFLGLSFGCARCHDHKFDPILQKDYFRLQAFFAPMIWRDDLPLATAEEKHAYEEQLQKWEAATAVPRARLEAALKSHMEKVATGAIKKFPDEVQAMVLKPEDQKTPYEKEVSYFVMRQAVEEQKKPAKIHGAADEAKREMKPFESIKPKPLPVAFVATDVAAEAPPTIMKSRKNGEQKVEPGFLSILDPGEPKIAPLTDINSTGRRSALAAWITRKDNPLAARVIVNRVWQQHFGRGLVATGSDFGHLGEKPSHPELLDWLAHEFVAHNWSFKWLHRKIMTSAVFRETAHVQPTEVVLKKDPENRLLWRMNPRRLDAEQARDTLLAISGEMDLTMGGPGEEPHKPRRTIYTRKIRNSEDEFLRSFDAPQGFQSVAQRDATTTALQSLLMINGDWPLQRAHAMATRLLKECGHDQNAVINRAYELAYSREPTAQELAAATSFLHTQENLPEHNLKKAPPVPVAPPLVDANRFFGKHPLSGAKAVAFRPRSAHEKLRVQTGDMEGDAFTIEAVIYLDSLYTDATVRTIASRWNNDKSSKGWAFGITSEKSRYQANNLIMQLCGDDFQSSTIYEVVASNIRIPLKTPYYVAAVISNKPNGDHQAGGTVTFYARNLADPEAPLENVTVAHPVVGGYSNVERTLYLGGRDQDPRSLWDGLLSRVTLTPGTLNEDELLVSKKQISPNCLLDAQAESILSLGAGGTQFAWENATAKPGVHSSETEALTDLCHVLINSNEFLYLH